MKNTMTNTPGLRNIGNSPGYETLHDVTFSRGNLALYTLKGYLIPESTLIRGPEGFIARKKTQEKIGPPVNTPVIEDPVTYAGDLSGTWGHFLTECSSRLWFFFEHPEFWNYQKFFCTRHPDRRHIHTLLKFSGITNLKMMNRDIHFKTLYMPYSAFQNRHNAYKVHSLFHEEIAKQFGPYVQEDKILYLSRRKMPNNKRKVHGEKELENHIKSLGGDIMYPEQTPVRDQIVAINSYSTVISCRGSALHSILFRVNPDPFKPIMLAAEGVSSNYHLVDAVKGIDTIYIRNSTTKDPNCKKKKTRQDEISNIDFIKKELDKVL